MCSFPGFIFSVAVNMLFCSPLCRLQVTALGCTAGGNQRAPQIFALPRNVPTRNTLEEPWANYGKERPTE